MNIKRSFLAEIGLKTLQGLSALLLNERFIHKDIVLEQKESFILCANHLTFIDALWITKLLSKKQLQNFAALGGADLLTDYGLLGKCMGALAPILPVDRKGNPIRGLIKAKKFLEQEEKVLLIHPEGTRSESGRLEYMHQGATLLAFKGNHPLVPVYIHGAYEVWKKGQKAPKFFKSFFKRNSLTLEVGPALLPQNYSSMEEMTEAMRQWFYKKQDEYLN